MSLEDDMSQKSPARSANRKGISPIKSPKILTQAHGAVTDLENKLFDV